MSGKKKESGKFRSVLLIIILPLMFLLIAGGLFFGLLVSMF